MLKTAEHASGGRGWTNGKARVIGDPTICQSPTKPRRHYVVAVNSSGVSPKAAPTPATLPPTVTV